MLKKLFRVKIVFPALLILSLFLLITNGVAIIQSDGYGSFHTTQCLINEHSWYCKQKPEYFPDYTYHAVSLHESKYVTVYAPGSALVNLPGQIVASLFTVNKTTYNDFFTATAGHTFAQGIAFLLTAVILAIASIILIYKSLRNLGFSEAKAIASTFIAYASSFAVWYVFLNSAFNHTTEIFALALFSYGFSSWLKKETKTAIILAALGIGLAVLARPPLLIVGACFGLYLLLHKKWKGLIILALIGLPFALVYISYNIASYGSAFASSYNILFSGQNFNFSQWNGLKVLFSGYRGWFVYSPALFFALIGLLLAKQKQRLFALMLFVPVVFTAVLYGFWPIWWGGGSYGQRFMISFVPFLAIGIAYLLQKLQKDRPQYLRLAYTLLAIAVSWTLILTVVYRFTPVVGLRPPSDFEGEMTSGDRYTPLDLFNYQRHLVIEATSVPNYGSRLIDSSAGGVSILGQILPIAKNLVRIDSRDSSQIKVFYLQQVPDNKEDPQILEFYLYEPNTQLVKKFSWAVTKQIESNTSNKFLQINCDSNGCIVNENEFVIKTSECSSLDGKLSDIQTSYKGFVFGSSTNSKLYFRETEGVNFRGMPTN